MPDEKDGITVDTRVTIWIDDVIGLLVDAGVGVAGVDLFYGPQPDDPVDCGTVMPYAGRGPEQAFGSDDPWIERPRANFMWRVKTNTGIIAALKKCQTASDALQRVTAKTVGSTYFQRINLLQSPGVLFEEEGMTTVGFSFECVIERY